MRNLTFCAILIATASTSACAAPVSKMTDPGRVSETPAASFAEDYKLGVGDKIRVIVYNEEALSGEFEVNGAGKVSLPLVGEMVASGQTTEQIADALRNTLSQGYLRDPHVSVEVLTYRPYFILGEIKTPAQYPYVNGMTVMNAIATAGGFTPRAARKRVYIRRSGEGEEKVFDLTPDLRIYPGDTVRLGERYF